MIKVVYIYMYVHCMCHGLQPLEHYTTHVYCGSVCMYYRILEVKHEMFKLEMLEFHYFDDLLTDMKLTPVR